VRYQGFGKQKRNIVACVPHCLGFIDDVVAELIKGELLTFPDQGSAFDGL
jgi:hypothetical protein